VFYAFVPRFGGEMAFKNWLQRYNSQNFCQVLICSQIDNFGGIVCLFLTPAATIATFTAYEEHFSQ